MSKYTPITITNENYQSAIRENILEAIKTLESKIRVDRGLPLPGLIASDNFVSLVGDAVDESSACTFQQFISLRDGA